MTIETLRKLNPSDSDYVKKIAQIGKTGWWCRVEKTILKKIISFIDTLVPESKSYDQIAACTAILQTRFSCVEKIPQNLLAHMGLGVESNRVYVKNNEQFWKHIITVINPQTNLNELLVVVQLAHYPSIRQKDWIQILTDPGTDSNSDDEISILYLERIRSIKKLNLWPRANYVITAGDAFGDRKKRATDILYGVNTNGCSITVYDPQYETRFYAPYAPPLYKIDPTLANFASACGNYLTSTDCLLIIGQMGTNFAQQLLNFKLRSLVVQGPGFNTLGTNVENLFKIATCFAYTDSNGAALLNTKIRNRLLKVASEYSHDIVKYRNMTIWGFLNTDEKSCFERQFKGFHFPTHYPQILELLE
jgi:hypothetical protein